MRARDDERGSLCGRKWVKVTSVGGIARCAMQALLSHCTAPANMVAEARLCLCSRIANREPLAQSCAPLWHRAAGQKSAQSGARLAESGGVAVSAPIALAAAFANGQ